MKILLVEDDTPAAAILSEVITAQHYTVDVATDGELGFQLATSCEYDLILLDLLVPKLDGIGLCRQLRAYGFQKPILLLTAKDSSSDVVKGLDAGADDYVTKPYDLSELLARMRALLRRGQSSLAPKLLTWQHLCVNPVSAEVTYRGQLLSLSPKEYALLGLFLRNPQRVFSRSDIIDRLWSIDASPSEGAVTNLIKDLRHKLKTAGMTTDLLETVYGLGYRLKPPPVPQSPVLQSPVPQPKVSDQPERTDPLGKTQPAGQEKRRTTGKKDLTSINRVLERYQSTFAARIVPLEQVEQALRSGTLPSTQKRSAVEESHRLAGTLGSFGYEKASHLARTLEQLLDRDQLLTPPEISQFSKLVAELKQELANPPIPSNPWWLEPPMPVVLVIDQDTAFIDQLREDSFAWGLRVEATTDFASIKQILVQDSPQAILLSLRDPIDDRLSLLQELSNQFTAVPVVVITDQDRLTDRVAVSRFGIKRFLHKPIATTAVFEAITQVISQSKTANARVMILDDDRVVLDTLRDMLQPWGLEVTTLQDPKQFWTVLTATQPDLLVLDLEMPTFSGLDLCRVVRQDPQWGNLPILVVTAHTNMESIQRVFAAGADDFIGKPVVGPELVTRVISRIDRSHLQQELATMKRRIAT